MNTHEFPNKNAVFTKAEQKIINYIYQNPSSLSLLSIGQFASQLGVSEATISRFVRHAGYNDFKELKYDIINQSDYATPLIKLSHTLKKADPSISNLLKYQQYCIDKTLEHLDENELSKAVDLISTAKKIYIYGKGAASSLASLFKFRLNRFGCSVQLINPGGSEIFEDLIHITKNDVVIIFGFQKTSAEANVILRHKKDIGYTIILITSRLYQKEIDSGDINLFVYRGDPSEYHSLTAPTALLDVLVVLIAKKLNNNSLGKLSELYHLKEQYRGNIPR